MGKLIVGCVLLGLALLVGVTAFLEMTGSGFGTRGPRYPQDDVEFLDEDPTVEVELKDDPTLRILDQRPVKIGSKVLPEGLIPPWERHNVDAEGFYHYTVRPEDTLSELSRTYLGKARLWTEIQEHNPDLADPRDLLPGTVILIPLWLRDG